MTQKNADQNRPALYFHENIRGRLLANTLWGGLVVVILVIVVLAGGIPTGVFWAGRNLQNVMWAWLPLALLAPTMVLIIASGGFDLSVGAVTGLTTVIMAWLLASADAGLGVVVMAGLGLALVVGIVNGFLIGVVRLNAVLVTLGMMTMLRGLAYIITEGKVIAAREVEPLSSFIIPGIVLILLIIVCIIATELKFMVSKRQAKPDGKGAWLWQSLFIGLPYVLSSLMAGLVGIIYLGRLRSGMPTLGTGLEVDIILIVFLGGTPFGRGLANIIGAVLAALILAVSQNIAIVNGISAFWLHVGKGAGLLIFGLLGHAYYYAANLIFDKNKKKAVVEETGADSASSPPDEGGSGA
ncbi:MAG: ABC transporter permease [Anaerolineae bacterium]|nr:ABC transporter permease [Anaerolineae bacterium]